MCSLRAISHCLIWHGSGHPRVRAMKGFLLDAPVYIVGAIVPTTTTQKKKNEEEKGKISIEGSNVNNVLKMTAA